MRGRQALVDVASAMFDGAGVQLYVWDAARQWLTPAAGNQLAVRDGPVPRRLGVGAGERAAALGAPVLLDDYRSSVDDGTPAGLAGITSAIGAPLLLEGRLIGAISVGVDSWGGTLSRPALAALSALANGWPKRDRLTVLEAIYCLYPRRAIAFDVHLLHDYDAAEVTPSSIAIKLGRADPAARPSWMRPMSPRCSSASLAASDVRITFQGALRGAMFDCSTPSAVGPNEPHSESLFWPGNACRGMGCPNTTGLGFIAVQGTLVCDPWPGWRGTCCAQPAVRRRVEVWAEEVAASCWSMTRTTFGKSLKSASN